MAPHLSIHLAARDDTSADQSDLNPIIIAGIVVAAVIAAGLAIWLAIHWYRKRAAAKRNARRGSAFVNFGGSNNTSAGGEKTLPSADTRLQVKGTFSRDQLNSNVVMPERAVLRPGATREEILEHYSSQGNLPRPFAPFQPRQSADFDHESGPLPFSSRPASGASWIPPSLSLGGSRDSRPMSAMSTASSALSGAGGATQKKVRQLFDPVLPDELVVSLGETLMIVQSFDDGWCIVGRDSMFTPGEVELGAVPAWCLLKPIKGLRAERPMRVSSLGVTVDLSAAPSMGPRDNVMSWSNF